MYPVGTLVDTTRARYPTGIEAMKDAGFASAEENSNPSLIWIDGVMSMDEAEKVKPHQRVNKIPCMDYICFKSTLFEELNNLRKKYPSIMNFYPLTFLLPNDYPELQRQHTYICGRTATAPTWVIKPRNGSCGRGIYLIQSSYEASNITTPSVAQQMVEPLLLDGLKFDFRFYLLVSSIEPFSAFIYKEGIARFCTEQYTPPTKNNRDHVFMNLTNTAINVGSTKSPELFTKLASEVIQKIVQTYPGAKNIWNSIIDVSRMLLASIYPTIIATLPNNGGKKFSQHVGDPDGGEDGKPKSPTQSRVYATGNNIGSASSSEQLPKILPSTANINNKITNNNKNNSNNNSNNGDENDAELQPSQHFFQLLGIDIIIDSNLQPKLLELNDRPSICVTVPFEKDLKTNMMREMFYHVAQDGSTLGENEKSGWHQILPVTGGSDIASQVMRVMQTQSNIRYIGRIAANSPTTNRMVTSGINNDLHAEHRQRAVELRESAKGRRFHNYLKNTHV